MGISKEDFCDFKGTYWDWTASAEMVCNSYAPVTAISSTSITIDTDNAIVSNTNCKFAVYSEVLFHVSASRNVNGNYATEYLGKWCWATITAKSGNLLTLNKDVTKILPAEEFSKYYVQAIAVFKIKSRLNINEEVTISPPAYSITKNCGGIIVIKNNGQFSLNKLNIDLTGKGIPAASKALRPWLQQELQGMKDTDPYAGWENGATTDRFMLNAGDGACFIVAKNIFIDGSATRIGNVNSKGVLNCRGAVDSANKPSDVTNVGGSTILLVSTYGRTIGNYGREKSFSKYRSTSLEEGQGLGRACFVSHATAGAIDDQGCVAIDALDAPNALTANFNIRDFGNGSLQNVTNPTKCINNYARISEVSKDRKQLTMKDGILAVTNGYNGGLAKIEAGALVMVVATSTSSDPEIFRQEHGKMTFAKILSVTSTKITIDKALPEFDASTVWQVVSVPQFKNFTLNKTYDQTPNYRGRASDKDITGVGGICVIACSETCDLRGGQIDVKFKGRPKSTASYIYTTLETASSDLAGQINYGEKVPNSNMTIRFPPGGGDGAVFILANKLIMDENTRIGHTGTGNKLGGTGIENNVEQAGGGFKAPDSTNGVKGGAGYDTGTGSYACSDSNRMGGNVLIIADTIQNFNLSAIATGGHGKLNNTRAAAVGGCGYGGGNVAGGGYHGGAKGAGCAGNAFIFCNNAVNQNLDGIIVSE